MQKRIDPIKRNLILAEFIGVLFGDGHVGKCQTSITLDSKNGHRMRIILKTS